LKYDLNLLLQAIDFSYNYEVTELGYLPPPGDNQAGGDDRYDIYIDNIAYYGYTQPEDLIPNSAQRFLSYIVLDNDFTTTATKGIDGARVTIAHELHHAIQIGSYRYRDSDQWFHEISSTAMEEFVYDSINDYYFYMDDYFENTYKSFASLTGYEIAIWNIYLNETFDFRILRRQWELITTQRALDAIAISISERNSIFQDVFYKFGVWVYYTGYRKVNDKYFEEGAEYPAAANLMERRYTPPSDTLTLNAMPVSHSFITLSKEVGGSVSDTFTVIISNSDYKQALTDPNTLEPSRYELYSDSAIGLTKLYDGYYQKFTAQNMSFWGTSEFLNRQLIREGILRVEGDFAFPSPFRYNQHRFIYIPVKMNREGMVDLNIYSSSMDLVYNERKDIERKFDKDVISWDGKSFGGKLGSGVYLYIIKSGDEISKGKIVLLND
jgi:hypothetical protein